MAKNDEMTVTNPSKDELKKMEEKKKKEPVDNKAETVELKQEEKIDLVTPAFSIRGRNGSQILDNREDISPCDRMILTIEEAKKVADRGFTLRWTVDGYENSPWYNQILAKWNFDFFAAFIKGEIEAGRLSKYSF